MENDQGDGDPEEPSYWNIYQGVYSYPLSTLTGTLDSGRVYMTGITKSVACTGDPYINVYTGDCQLGGQTCTTTVVMGDTANCTTLRRRYKVSEWPTNASFTMRVDSCITIGGTHTLDIRFACAVNPFKTTGVCECTLDKDNEISMVGATAVNKPYLVVYTTEVGGRKRTSGHVVTDRPDVWPLRKQLIYGDGE